MQLSGALPVKVIGKLVSETKTGDAINIKHTIKLSMMDLLAAIMPILLHFHLIREFLFPMELYICLSLLIYTPWLCSHHTPESY